MRMHYYCLLLSGVAACSGGPAETTRAPGVAAAPKPARVDPFPAAATAPGTSPVGAAPAAGAGCLVARQPLTRAQLPAALRPSGHLLEAGRWLDLNGENVLVASRTVAGAGDAGRTARLLVRQYVRSTGSSGPYRQLWQLQDAVADCSLDLTLGLRPGSTRVSDLDGDGRTETTLVYACACQGDVEPAGLKLVMHEGAAKYALRGTALEMRGSPAEMARAHRQAAGPTCCTVAVPDSAYWRNDGLYASEQEFATAPPAFLAFARQHWRQWRTRADAGTEVQ